MILVTLLWSLPGLAFFGAFLSKVSGVLPLADDLSLFFVYEKKVIWNKTTNKYKKQTWQIAFSNLKFAKFIKIYPSPPPPRKLRYDNGKPIIWRYILLKKWECFIAHVIFEFPQLKSENTNSSLGEFIALKKLRVPNHYSYANTQYSCKPHIKSWHHVSLIRLMEKNPANQLRLVVYPIIYYGFYTSKQWLFGISEPSTVCLLGHPIYVSWGPWYIGICDLWGG